MHLMSIVVACGVLMMVTENAFAEPKTESSNANPSTQTGYSATDDHSDGEINDDHASAQQGPLGDSDGSQQDQTESGK